MQHEKIQSTIGLIDDVVDNRQKENDNANTAKRDYHLLLHHIFLQREILASHYSLILLPACVI